MGVLRIGSAPAEGKYILVIPLVDGIAGVIPSSYPLKVVRHRGWSLTIARNIDRTRPEQVTSRHALWSRLHSLYCKIVECEPIKDLAWESIFWRPFSRALAFGPRGYGSS